MKNYPSKIGFYLVLTVMLLVIISGCSGSGGSSSSTDTPLASDFAKGADVSWLTEMEAAGYKFYNDSGNQEDLFTILKEHGINAIRLRIWVNPSDGWCNQEDVLAKAKRAANAGMNIMIDFHYSDTWADPSNQKKPSAWANDTTIDELCTHLYNHTITFLTALKSTGVTPKWVQVGNETNAGMLFGYYDNSSRAYVSDGSLDLTNLNNHFSEYAQLVTTGYNAVKSVFPDCLVVVHLSNGYDNSLYQWNIGGLVKQGAKFDVIGMSLYPSTGNWSSYARQCLSNMNDMVSRYGKKVMICETGMDCTAAATCKSFLLDLIKKVNSVSGGNGLGVFYWEPECYDWKGYTMGAWGSDGKPTVALDAFLYE